MKRLLIVLLLFNSLVLADKLPNVKFKNLENKKAVLDTFFVDGPIAVNVWNLACEPCKKEMKYLSEYNIHPYPYFAPFDDHKEKLL